MNRIDKDRYFINRTFKLAKKAEGFTSPNPLVGAVIVKQGRVISSGYHKKAGSPHAEIEAIRRAKEKTEGSTLYVNLEPCFHWGRTPPCVGEIIKSKISKVVISTPDPNPAVRGKSINKLKKAGIEVKVGVEEKEARELNEIFFKNMSQRRPFVTVKAAQSLDGKIATKRGISKWITSKPARDFAKSLRDKYESILVGINTVIADNPSLCGLNREPFKVVLDPRLRIPLNSCLLTNSPHKLMIFTSFKNKRKLKRLASANVFLMKKTKRWFSLKGILAKLYSRGINSLFVEGGAQTIGRFFDERLVDKVYFFISPKIIGGAKAPSSVGGEGCAELKHIPRLKRLAVKRIGGDILICGYPVYPVRKPRRLWRG